MAWDVPKIHLQSPSPDAYKALIPIIMQLQGMIKSVSFYYDSHATAHALQVQLTGSSGMVVPPQEAPRSQCSKEAIATGGQHGLASCTAHPTSNNQYSYPGIAPVEAYCHMRYNHVSIYTDTYIPFDSCCVFKCSTHPNGKSGTPVVDIR